LLTYIIRRCLLMIPTLIAVHRRGVSRLSALSPGDAEDRYWRRTRQLRPDERKAAWSITNARSELELLSQVPVAINSVAQQGLAIGMKDVGRGFPQRGGRIQNTPNSGKAGNDTALWAI